ncbi:MAG: hypothetical protein ACOC45_07805, partial [Alkalispirochaetaceae bacterium]
RRYPGTCFAFARHRLDPTGFEAILLEAVQKANHRNGRFVDLLGLCPDKEALVSEEGTLTLPPGSYTVSRLVG